MNSPTRTDGVDAGLPAVRVRDVSIGKLWSGTARVACGIDVIDERSAGFAAGSGSPACSPATRFQAGSISKLVLSTVVLQLADRHELHLHEPITQWLDEVPSLWRTITLHQLLSHASGLGHWGDIPGLPPLLETPPPRDELVALIASAPLSYRPGASWRYSGPGFVVAALVVEAVTRMAYRDVAAELVFQPAALRDTTSGELPVGRPNVAAGHRDGHPIRVDPGFAEIPGTGDLWTTTEDLIRLNQALRGGQVIEPASAARLWTPHAMLAGSGGANGPTNMRAYGYGTFLGQLKGRKARINPGDNPGYQSVLAYLPDQDLDVVVLCNQDAPSVDAALSELSLR